MDNLVAIPVLSIYRRLLVSLQGDVSDSQMEELTRTVLKRIHETNAEGLVIDTSGIWMMDSHMCAVLGRLAAAARLMGARPVLSGLSPSIVMTLQTMGIDLSGVETALGVEEALETLGLEVYERRSDEADDDLDLGSEEDGDDAPSDAVDR
jgi:rsbT antagonist protein RsbS